ncbi:MAG: hypothetical protein RSB41_02790 [Bacilli bacterium]
MKKIMVGIVLLSMFLFVGCSLGTNTPTKKSEEFLNRYKNLNDSVIKDLELNAEREGFTKEDQKKAYIEIIKTEYKNMTYKIDSEDTKEDISNVKATIKVYNLYSIEDDSRKYLATHPEEFKTDNKYDNEKFIDYRLKQLKNAKEKISHTITLQLKKVDGKWIVQNPDTETLQKLHGLYNSK